MQAKQKKYKKNEGCFGAKWLTWVLFY